MTYPEARRYIESLQARGWRLELDRMEVFLQRLGNPHDGLRAFHVAGTNGKGTVTGMIAACLTAGGYRTGSYFSPYVYDFRERIQIDGEMISKKEVARLTTEIRPIADEMVYEDVGGPTEFEFKTAMAFLYWKQSRIDVASVEVGLGGRLDATNVIDLPLCSVITEIGLDHQQFLGKTVEKIAFEKAGIIKPGRPVVTGVTDDRAYAVIDAVARERGSFCVRVGPKADPEALSSWVNEGGRPEDADAVVEPEFVRRNRAVAIEALKLGLPIAEEHIVKGLRGFTMPGRMEVVSESPRIVFDGAHNEQAIRAVLQAIPGEIVCVYSCAIRHRPLLDVVEARCRRVFSAPMNHPRGLPKEEWDPSHPSVVEALRSALDDVREGETLLVTGSFYLLGEAKAALAGLTSER
jgi:dihydrofolate synthase/folylpolyglutamate synthase